MNSKAMTQEDLYKTFPVGDTGYTIARIDYVSMPCSMLASWFSDKEMEDLAFEISRFFVPDGENQDADDVMFWEEMERCAVLMGMAYYEDIYEDWLEAFQNLPIAVQVGIYNQVVETNEEIHAMDDFNDIIENKLEFTPFDVFVMTCKTNCESDDNWWKLTQRNKIKTMGDDSVQDEIERFYEEIFDNKEYWEDDINIKDLKDDDN